MTTHPLPSPATLAWLRTALGDDVAAITPLVGGVAQSVTAVTLADGREFVLRRWSRPRWRETDPDHSPANEIRALTALAATGLPVPRLVDADPEGEYCDHPALLMTRLPGTILSSATHHSPDAEPLTCDMLRQLAEAATVLHALDGHGLAPFRQYEDLSAPEPPPASRRPGLWERAFERASAPPPPTTPAFIHRDYHPGNTLWRDGRLTGIIDWTSASLGPAGQDYGHLRVNLLLAYGQATADALLPFVADHHPYWDLRAFFDLVGVDPAPEDLPTVEPYLESLVG